MNCPCPQFDLQKYRNKPYEQTPCASCFMTKETNKTNKHAILYDTDGAIDQSQEPYVQPQEQLPQQIQQLSEQSINMIMQACQQNFLITLSNIVIKLTDLAKTYPPLYQILHYKMQHPEMSYHQIGVALSQPCSKQNVLYHLTHAVKQFPDLYKAILTDTRFSGGRYAIKTAADKRQKQIQVQRVRKKLYDESQINRRKSLQELKEQFSKPFKVEAITDFKDVIEKKEKSNAESRS